MLSFITRGNHLEWNAVWLSKPNNWPYFLSGPRLGVGWWAARGCQNHSPSTRDPRRFDGPSGGRSPLEGSVRKDTGGAHQLQGLVRRTQKFGAAVGKGPVVASGGKELDLMSMTWCLAADYVHPELWSWQQKGLNLQCKFWDLECFRSLLIRLNL